jgi:hypothetical protein
MAVLTAVFPQENMQKSDPAEECFHDPILASWSAWHWTVGRSGAGGPRCPRRTAMEPTLTALDNSFMLLSI